MRKTKIYIAGPITGMPNLNCHAFFNADGVLRRAGHIPLNPAVLPEGLEHAEYMKICLPMIDAAEAVIMLPGWENSKGANMEFQYAQIKNLPVFEAEFGYYDTERGDFVFGPEDIHSNITLEPNHNSQPALRLSVLKESSNENAPNLHELRA